MRIVGQLAPLIPSKKSDLLLKFAMAAYVVKGPGHQAISLENDIFENLHIGSERLVRLYFVSALRIAEADEQQSLTYPRDRLALLSQHDDVKSDGEYYTVSDERIETAAILFVSYIVNKDIRQFNKIPLNAYPVLF